MKPQRYLPRALPAPLRGLEALAVDLRWSWNHSADALWASVDEELWRGTGDPWLILESVSEARLEALARDAVFLDRLERQRTRRQEYLEGPTWFGATHGASALGCVAYFSMEYGLGEALPIYSGGLGILAGDYLKTASDLGVPLVGVGLMYQQGYFRQALGVDGEQVEYRPYNAPTMLPVLPVEGPEGGWLYVTVDLPGRSVRLRLWQVLAGRVNLYLLDSNDLLNAPADRSITGALYGGGPDMRLQQEIALGIGGWRALKALGLECTVCHLNEGHAAFVVLERARDFAATNRCSFHEALWATRAGNLFTTHTPVAAGFDRFSPALMAKYFAGYAREMGVSMEELLALGRATPQEPFNMAYLALRGAGRANGVSRLHGEVSRRIFQPLFPRWPEPEVPVDHLTNGVHMPSWDSAAADHLWTEACGKSRWMGTLERLEEDFRAVSDERLWAFRTAAREQLVRGLRERMARQCASRGGSPQEVGECAYLLDPNALTLGFARRFVAYKRPNLLLHDRQRLKRLLLDRERPVQIVVAGKAHPQDPVGRRMIQEWVAFMRGTELAGRAVFAEDYDMALAAELVQGVDVWLNTPRRPWEASGTSGMKVLVNGGLNLSELDGWWAEAYEGDSVGWALGDGAEHGDDPAWDAREAEALYRLLEERVVPLFYRRDEHGVPRQWLMRVRESMARLTPRFSANRMVREYVEQAYLPAAAAFRRRAAEGGRLGAELHAWHRLLGRHWRQLHFGRAEVAQRAGEYLFRVPVYLDELPAEAVRVELYADPSAALPAERHVMVQQEPLRGAVNGYLYTLRLAARRPPSDYTARIVPYHPEAAVPLEAAHILWQR